MTVRHSHPPDETRVAHKSADQAVNNSTTLVDCTDLKLEVGANEIWGFYLFLRHNTGSTPDLKMQWDVPSGCGLTWQSIQAESTTSLNPATDLVVDGLTTFAITVLAGSINNATNPGTAQLKFAQNVADPSDTKILAHSYIIFWKLQ